MRNAAIFTKSRFPAASCTASLSVFKSSGLLFVCAATLLTGCRQAPKQPTSPTPLPGYHMDAPEFTPGSQTLPSPQTFPNLQPVYPSQPPSIPPAGDVELPPLPGTSALPAPRSGMAAPVADWDDVPLLPIPGADNTGVHRVRPISDSRPMTDAAPAPLVDEILPPLPLADEPYLSIDDQQSTSDEPLRIRNVGETATPVPVILDRQLFLMELLADDADDLLPAPVTAWRSTTAALDGTARTTSLPEPLVRSLPPSMPERTVMDWPASGIPFDMVITPGPIAQRPTADGWRPTSSAPQYVDRSSDTPRRLANTQDETDTLRLR